MDINNHKYHRRSIRLPEYNYTLPGYYYVTICVKDRNRLFGDIQKDGKGTIFCALNKYGEIVKQCWEEIPKHYENIDLDEYIIMPNHIHGIIIVQNIDGVQNIEPLQNKYQHIISGSIGAIIRGFKIGATKLFRQYLDISVWQRNYYEHIIRNESELNHIRKYIIDNPMKWQEDEYNQINKTTCLTTTLTRI